MSVHYFLREHAPSQVHPTASQLAPTGPRFKGRSALQEVEGMGDRVGLGLAYRQLPLLPAANLYIILVGGDRPAPLECVMAGVMTQLNNSLWCCRKELHTLAKAGRKHFTSSCTSSQPRGRLHLRSQGSLERRCPRLSKTRHRLCHRHNLLLHLRPALPKPSEAPEDYGQGMKFSWRSLMHKATAMALRLL